MYLRHFGLTHAPLGKDIPTLWDDGNLTPLTERFAWLLDAPGIGLLTGESGVGKTIALRQITTALNPHRYRIVYSADTDFARVDVYRNFALALGLPPVHRRAQLWRELKTHIRDLVDTKQLLPVWILDEAQNLPPEFFRDFASFLNVAFDSRDLLTVWLVGHPSLARLLDHTPYAALHSRLRARVQLDPILDRARFAQLIAHGFQCAGCQHTLLADSGLELLRQASRGNPREASRILDTALRLAAARKLNHLPDEVLQQAIEELR